MTEYKRVRVLVETSERSFRGYISKPVKDESYRLSDYLNDLQTQFINLTEVELAERGQHWRVGDRMDFVAISVSAITYVTPIGDE